MKIALVHDYLREFGGAERVLMALHAMFPEAPVYTAFYDQKSLGLHAKHFAGWNIHETWLAKVPLIKKLYSPLRFLAPKAFADLDLSKFDLVISSSNAYFAKAVKVPHGKHFCYCHTPPRVMYGYSVMSEWRSNPLLRWAGTLLNHFLRVIDLKVSRENVDVFIANSEETARRIKKFYKRDSIVIHPPIEIPRKPNLVPSADRPFYLYAGRLTFSKHPELAVAACNKLSLPLKVVGLGKMDEKLREIAGPTIELLGDVSDQELEKLYAQAKALIYPSEDEDFGMVPVEAMGWGTPVIAHRSGGPQETVVEGKTGLFFDKLTIADLVKALQKFQKTVFSPAKIHQHAFQFDQEVFSRSIKRVISQKA
ncbi:MAG: glycosyltransferase [Candidatus Paceibacterota bacterium]